MFPTEVKHVGSDCTLRLCSPLALRYKVDVPIRVIVSSEGGMALFAGAELKPGSQVAVEFTPAYSAPPIRVDATVCNRTGYNYGVEFLTASDSQKQRVEELCRHLPTMAAIPEPLRTGSLNA